MPWWRRLFSRRRLDAQLDAELRDHLDRLVSGLIASGLSEAEARRQAALTFGGLDAIAEGCRDARGTRWLEDLGADLRYALRVLRRSPAFSAVAALSLALGIGANIAVVSLADAVLLRTLPVRAPHELVLLAERLPGRESLSWSRAQFHAFATSGALAGVCAFRPRVDFSIATVAGTDLVPGQLVSGNCFDVIGARAALGRTLTPEDEEAGEARPVAVISHGFWQRAFGGDAAIVGRTLQLKGRTFTIVGVTPREFFGLEPGRSVDVTIPLSLQPLVLGGARMSSPDVRWMRLIGRLRADGTRDRAAGALERVFHQLPAGRPGAAAPQSRLELRPGAQGLNDLRQQFSVPLRILMAAVALLLLLACANLASLMLARARARDHEIALRLALGAGRFRIIRQLLTESLVLSAIGGLAGVAVASWGTQAIVALLSRGRAPILLPMAIDARLLAFAFVLSVATGLVFGIWPALWATRRARHVQLQATSRTMTTGGRLRAAALIAAQTTVSAVLLSGAVLFARTLGNLHAVDVGFDQDHVLLVGIRTGIAAAEGPSTRRVYEDLIARLSAAPEVRSVSMSMDVPLGGISYTASVAVPPQAADPDETVNYNFVGPRFFETLRIPVLSGRDFRWDDNERSRPVAVVSASLAAHYFPGRNAVGEHLQAGTAIVEIVGVVKDVPYAGLRVAKERMIYRPYFQESAGGGTFVLRTDLPAGAAADLVRTVLREIAPAVPVSSVVPLDAHVDAGIASERLLADISLFFGVMALLLVGIGVYGTLAYAIAQRTRELGVRAALGASRGAIAMMILRGALAPVCLGLVLGAPLAAAAGEVARGQLFGVTPRDPMTYAAVVAVLLAAALLAAAVPAHRAVRADPIIALRQD